MKLTIENMEELVRHINTLPDNLLNQNPCCFVYQTKDQIESQGTIGLTLRFVSHFFPSISKYQNDYLLLPHGEEIRAAVEIINSDFNEEVVEEKLQWLASNYSGMGGFKYAQDSWEEYLSDKNLDDMPPDNLWDTFYNYYLYLKIWCIVSELCCTSHLPSKRRRKSYGDQCNRPVRGVEIRFSDYFFNSDQFNFFWDLSLRYPKYLPNIFKRIFEFKDFFGSSRKQKFLHDNGLYMIAVTLLSEIIICRRIPFYNYIRLEKV